MGIPLYLDVFFIALKQHREINQRHVGMDVIISFPY